jgi:hypothetical protein
MSLDVRGIGGSSDGSLSARASKLPTKVDLRRRARLMHCRYTQNPVARRRVRLAAISTRLGAYYTFPFIGAYLAGGLYAPLSCPRLFPTLKIRQGSFSATPDDHRVCSHSTVRTQRDLINGENATKDLELLPELYSNDRNVSLKRGDSEHDARAGDTCGTSAATPTTRS